MTYKGFFDVLFIEELSLKTSDVTFLLTSFDGVLTVWDSFFLSFQGRFPCARYPPL